MSARVPSKRESGTADPTRVERDEANDSYLVFVGDVQIGEVYWARGYGHSWRCVGDSEGAYATRREAAFALLDRSATGACS